MKMSTTAMYEGEEEKMTKEEKYECIRRDRINNHHRKKTSQQMAVLGMNDCEFAGTKVDFKRLI